MRVFFQKNENNSISQSFLHLQKNTGQKDTVQQNSQYKKNTVTEDAREGVGAFIDITVSGEKPSKNTAEFNKGQLQNLQKYKQNAEIQKVVAQLKATDLRVKAHEAAHMSAGAGLVTSAASYTYQTGPDGKQYAVGGEVGIDNSPADTPQATIIKMQQVRAAALAPANPSSQDLSVAASATATEAAAQADLTKSQNELQEQ